MTYFCKKLIPFIHQNDIANTLKSFYEDDKVKTELINDKSLSTTMIREVIKERNLFFLKFFHENGAEIPDFPPRLFECILERDSKNGPQTYEDFFKLTNYVIDMIFKQKNIAKDPENDIIVQTNNSRQRLEILHEGLNETLFSAISRKNINDLHNIVTFMNTLHIEPKNYVIRYACRHYSRQMIDYLIENYGNKFIDETGIDYTTGKYYMVPHDDDPTFLEYLLSKADKKIKDNFLNQAHSYVSQARTLGLHKMADWFVSQAPNSSSKKRKTSL